MGIAELGAVQILSHRCHFVHPELTGEKAAAALAMTILVNRF
jgi:hypothetical protein